MIDYEKEMIRESDEGFIAGHKKALDELEKWVQKEIIGDSDRETVERMDGDYILDMIFVKIEEMRKKQ